MKLRQQQQPPAKNSWSPKAVRLRPDALTELVSSHNNCLKGLDRCRSSHYSSTEDNATQPTCRMLSSDYGTGGSADSDEEDALLLGSLLGSASGRHPARSASSLPRRSDSGSLRRVITSRIRETSLWRNICFEVYNSDVVPRCN